MESSHVRVVKDSSSEQFRTRRHFCVIDRASVRLTWIPGKNVPHVALLSVL